MDGPKRAQVTDQVGNAETSTALRPVERAVTRLAERGLSNAEIAWRFRRTPGYIARVLDLARVERHPSTPTPTTGVQLRPVERCVLRAREGGAAPAEIAARLRRTPSYVLRVEGFANFKRDRASA